MFDKKNYIYAIYKEKSFSKASKKLYISQPSLSAIIQKVEKQLQTTIFDRSSSPISLTDFGQKYIAAVEQIYDIEKELTNYISDLNDSHSGSFSLGCNSVYISYILPKYIFEFSKAYPNIRIQLMENNTENLQKKISNNELDLILDNTTLSDPMLEKYYFATEHLILAVPQNFKSNQIASPYKLTYSDILNNNHLKDDIKPVPLSIFKDDPFIAMTLGNDTRERSDNIFKHFHISPTILFEFNQLSTVFNVASSGSACCIVSDALIKNLNHCVENVCFYCLPITFSRRDVFFQFKKNKYFPKALSSFMNICLNNKFD